MEVGVNRLHDQVKLNQGCGYRFENKSKSRLEIEILRKVYEILFRRAADSLRIFYKQCKLEKSSTIKAHSKGYFNIDLNFLQLTLNNMKIN